MTWTVAIITLAGVVVGALASYLTTRLTARSRWQREERLRWDTKRLECYTDFSAAIMQFINVADRMSASRGLATASESPKSSAELPELSSLEADLSLRWAQLLLLCSPQVAEAAQQWRNEALQTAEFARGQNANATEFEDSRRRRREARARFYIAVRADFGVTSGDIPAELGTRLSSAITPLMAGELEAAAARGCNSRFLAEPKVVGVAGVALPADPVIGRVPWRGARGA